MDAIEGKMHAHLSRVICEIDQRDCSKSWGATGNEGATGLRAVHEARLIRELSETLIVNNIKDVLTVIKLPIHWLSTLSTWKIHMTHRSI